VYEFGEFRLDIAERRLSKAGAPIPLATKSHDLLSALLHNAGRLVTKRELLDQVWPGSFVEEGILSVHISTLRKALGQGEDRCFIETVSRAGYRFLAPVSETGTPPVADPARRWSIAVLPARPHTGEALSGRDHATGLALADTLIDRLGRLPELIVRPTSAVQSFRNSGEDPAEIG